MDSASYIATSSPFCYPEFMKGDITPVTMISEKGRARIVKAKIRIEKDRARIEKDRVRIEKDRMRTDNTSFKAKFIALVMQFTAFLKRNFPYTYFFNADF